MKSLKLQIIQAFSGDSIFLTYLGNDSTTHHILVDGGMPNTFKNSIKKLILDIDYIDYVFLTHIDRDHIGGILKLLGSSHKDKIKNILFNSGNIIKVQDSILISENDGKELINYINESDRIKTNKEEITVKTKFDFDGLKISFLSPTYETLKYFNENYLIGEIKEEALISDTTEEQNNQTLEKLSKIQFIEKSLKNDSANGVSLAMFLEHSDKKILLLGDAKDSVLIETLEKLGYKNQIGKRLKVDYLKLSHHGSKYHSSNQFLSLIECQHFIISTNGSGNSRHPNIEVIARILCHPNRDINKKNYFYFNYPKEKYVKNNIRLLTLDEEKQYNCESIYNKTSFEIEV